MLSLLIPVYNFDVTDLVRTLQKQCDKERISYEICVYDDGSLDSYKFKNNTLSQWNNLVYHELPKNIGRSKIRNLLAQDAVYDNLIFFDCDSKINQSDFIVRYKKFFEEKIVVYGGRTYQDEPPRDKNVMLRWVFGKKREEVSAVKRQKRPYTSFMSNNFYMHKSLFKKVGFLEELDQYGHEDSAFSHLCKKESVPILHIENPLEHLGLETAEEFLLKTKQAIENLVYLVDQDLISSNLKLFKAYKGLKKTNMDKVFYRSYLKTKGKILTNLRSENPNLSLFDFYKLGELVSLYQK